MRARAASGVAFTELAEFDRWIGWKSIMGWDLLVIRSGSPEALYRLSDRKSKDFLTC
jgi:hypothetical protein